jgi:c-di-GMP-binding flagellar brake protein YcgR
MAGDIIDRRKHPRFNVEKAIYIEVVRRGSRSEADNTIIRCETLDVSAGGLRVAVPMRIPERSILNIAVPMGDWDESLELIGEAMWVRPADNNKGYWVGLALKDSNREDMAKWFKVVHSLKG